MGESKRELLCEKCQRPVSSNNNVLVFNLLKGGFSKPTWVVKGQHLLPVVENGKTICEGEPSITQYLEGYPRDPSLGCYDPALEDEVRRTFRQLQVLK